MDLAALCDMRLKTDTTDAIWLNALNFQAGVGG